MQRTNIPKIKIGYQVGKLTVTEATAERKNGYTVWRCACDCGGSILLDTRTLQRGTIKDCGCVTKTTPGQKDLTGRRFGRLVCVEPTAERGKSGGTVWLCKCDCGNRCRAVSTQLTHGYKKSCGCLSRPPRKDFIGKCFGKLTVLGYAGKRNGMHRWKCRCDCGQETIVGQTLLQSGKTRSCGCLQKECIRNNLCLVAGTSVTKLKRMKNRTISTNTSGHTGVYKQKKTGKWVAQIGFRNKMYYLGTYERKEDAIQARKSGERMHDDFLEWYHSVYLNEKADDQK